MFNNKLQNPVCDRLLDVALVAEGVPEGFKADLCQRDMFSFISRNILGVTLDVTGGSRGYKSAELIFQGDSIRDQIAWALRDLRPIHEELRGVDETASLSRMRFVEESGERVRARLKLVFQRTDMEHMFTFDFRPGILRGFRTYEAVGESALKAIRHDF